MAHGKVYQDTKSVVMHRAGIIKASITTYGDAVDTRGYDSALVLLNVGAVKGVVTLSATVQEAEVWSGDSNWVTVTGASFTVGVSSGNQQLSIGSINTKSYKRYLALKLATTTEESAGSQPITLGVAATCIMGRGDTDPSGQTATFDLN